MSLTPEQEQAVRELRADYHVRSNTGLKARAEILIDSLSQTQSALERAQRERDEAVLALANQPDSVHSVWKKERDELQAKLDTAEQLAEEYRLRLPTTAQAMVYQSLLNKYETLEKERDELQAKFIASEAAGAETRNKLELARHHYIRQNAIDLNQLYSMPTPYDVITPCGQSFLDERKRHVKALEEIRTLKEGAGPCARAWVIAQEALKETK